MSSETATQASSLSRPFQPIPGIGRSVVWLAAVLGLLACGGAPRELVDASEAMGSMTHPRILRNSAFYVAYPDGGPSEFVSFVFSDLGAAEWPLGEYADPLELEQQRALGMPVLPADVAVVHGSTTPDAGLQVVLRGDEDCGCVVVEGYTDPEGSPVLRREWPLERVAPSEFARHAARSAIEMGIGIAPNDSRRTLVHR